VHSNAGITKRGARTIAPKKAKLVESSKTQKVQTTTAHLSGEWVAGRTLADSGVLQKLSAQLAAGTERRLAARVGHLELVAGGKKDKKKEIAEKK
jgi:hypothetical protein